MASLALSALNVIVLLLAVTSTSADDPQELLDNACRQSRVYDFCIQALESDPKTVTASSVLDLARIALNLAIQNTTSSKMYIQELVGKSEGSTVKRALKKCVKCYKLGIRELEIASEEIEIDPMTANYDVYVAMRASTNCDQAFKDAKVSVSSVSHRNDVLSNFCQIGVVLTNMLGD